MLNANILDDRVRGHEDCCVDDPYLVEGGVLLDEVGDAKLGFNTALL